MAAPDIIRVLVPEPPRIIRVITPGPPGPQGPSGGFVDISASSFLIGTDYTGAFQAAVNYARSLPRGGNVVFDGFRDWIIESTRDIYPSVPLMLTCAGGSR